MSDISISQASSRPIGADSGMPRVRISALIERDFSAPPLKLTVAPNGARRDKKDHPQIPVTIEEIASTARRCQTAGAAEVHLHVRDRQGRHSLDAGLYREAIAAIEDVAPGMGVQITTEAAGLYSAEEQFTCLAELAPKAASISVREVFRAPETAARIYGFAAETGTRVQHILYDSHDLDSLRAALREGTVPGHMRDVLLVLGRYSPAIEARPAELPPFVRLLGREFPNWTVCAFGRFEHLVAVKAAQMGGHVRIGFENNLQRPDGEIAAENAANIARFATAARALGRPLLSQGSST